jgi:hypothetical protein
MAFVPFTNDQLIELETRYDRVEVVTAPAPKRQRHHVADPEIPWSVVYRSPTMGESDAFEGAANNERMKPGALRELARKIVVGVSHRGTVTLHDGERGKRSKAMEDAWERLRGDFPAVHLAGQGAIMSLMGGEAEEAGKE